MSLKEKVKNADVVKEMNLPLFLCAVFAAVSHAYLNPRKFEHTTNTDWYLDGGSLVWNWFDDMLAGQRDMLTGTDYGYWSGLLGMTQFRKDFGRYDEHSQAWIIPATLQSAGSSIPIAGLAAGSLASGWVGNALGRIRTLQLSTVIAVIGILIQSTTFKSYWQLVIGRIVNAIGLGIVANCIPAYLAEISPLKIRGTLINFYQTSIGTGALIVSCVNWATHDRTDQWAYRLVIIIQFIIPVGFLAATFFLPESPRWLVGKDRSAEAENALARLRPNTPLEVLRQETALILAQEEENRSQFSRSWKECFR
jgi:SP family sugar:H+ symporter-like MFS transporter